MTSYLALSYVWGDPKTTKPLLLDGRVILITESLDQAIRHLISVDEHPLQIPDAVSYGAPPTLRGASTLHLRDDIWIDAICINQQDVVEKSSQVQRMREIFQKAKAVIIWLGLASDESDAAMECFQQIGRDMYDFMRTGPGTSAMLKDLEKRKNLEFPLTAVKAFCERPWWQRAWIVQEMAVAKNVLYLCGKCFLFEEYWLWAFFIFTGQVSQYNMNKSHHSQPLALSAAYLSNLGTIGQVFHTPAAFMMGTRHNFRVRAKQPLVDLLLRACQVGIGASDPRDRVYALLGIAADAGELGIRVDYSKPVERVFVEATVALLSQGNLHLLSFCQSSERRSGLPSWAPDWSSRMELNPLLHEKKHCKLYYSASGGSQPRVEFSHTESLRLAMVVSGVCFDTVRTVGVAFPTEESRVRVNAWFSKYDALVGSAKMYDSPGALDDAAWRTLIMDLEFENRDEEGKIYRAKPSFRDGFISTRLLFKGGWDAEVDINTALHYWSRLQPRWEDVVPVVSSQGYLGLAPRNTQVGDRIAIFLGATKPYILRANCFGNYELVGEAYLHGIMDGEVMAGSPRIEMILLT